MVAKYRPQATIIAATRYPEVMRKLSMVWGVKPVLIPETSGTDELLEESIKAALEAGFIEYGDLLILTAGVPSSAAGGTNMMKVHVAGKIIVHGMGIGKQPVSGKARIIYHEGDLNKIEPGDIIVTPSAHRDLAPYLDRIGGLIAEEGGLTSNAAIIGLNAGIPVIVGAPDASKIIEDGLLITMIHLAARFTRHSQSNIKTGEQLVLPG
ncbi:pyruvate kinase alpha/beta domain-containing protein [Syntrophomonas palmitatica]|uniref:pyruvate kinase alpha/beta domain-containing protein n=1 Tax=Syntrophomonas palmitatica TaxID=402877 RepID=UPI0034E298CF